MPFAQMEISMEEFSFPSFTISTADSYRMPTTGMDIYCVLSERVLRYTHHSYCP